MVTAELLADSKYNVYELCSPDLVLLCCSISSSGDGLVRASGSWSYKETRVQTKAPKLIQLHTSSTQL